MMSIKELFSSYDSKQFTKAMTAQSASALVESSGFIEAKRVEAEQFTPPIDFATASNFAKFGSAELYYENSFKRIYQRYPYDGTLAEKTEFHNSSSYLDKYVFDHLYPRTNGYIVLDGTSYIKVLGGPHTASVGMEGKKLNTTFDQSMAYSPENRRASGFEMNMTSGSTVEFWLNRTNSNTPAAEFIFDLWNGEVPGTADYGRFALFLGTGGKSLLFSLTSGSNSISNELLTTEAFDGNWNHFAFTVGSRTTGTKVKLFKNNEAVYEKTISTTINDIRPVSSGINATIGAAISSSSGTEGVSKLTGSLDEFRFWKTERDHESISNTWFIPIGGGTNKYDSNVDLGVYFKFNEGITGDTDIDSVVLDYSGRIHNGVWNGYSAGQRNIGSAIVSSSVAAREFKDPIIYSTHPSVSSSLDIYKVSGSLSDRENNSLLYGYFPAWMQETDTDSGKNLKKLSQIMASYFDTLWLQIDYLNKIKDDYYVSGSNTPLPFANKLLYNRGFVMPNLFGDANIVERLRQRDDNEVYEKELYEVRNTLYHNLYNNLLNIYKSKGTEKSFRNFFRSIGINSELVRLNMYADDSTFVLRDNYMYKSFERKFLNFNNENHFDATIYHTRSVDFGNVNSYIPGGKAFDSYTLETEIILPKKHRDNEINLTPFGHTTASVVGFHEARTDATDYNFVLGQDNDLHVLVQKEKAEDQYGPESAQRIRYALSGSEPGILGVSPFFSYQYQNNKWNLALRVKSAHYPFVNVTGATSNYVIELYGVEAEANVKKNTFLISTTVTSSAYVTSRKRFYGGAHRTNFNGSVINNTDVKLGYMRYWHSYMSDIAVNQHAFDSETFGINNPFENDLVNDGSNEFQIEVPREKTLAFHWAFNMLTSSDGNGQMVVLDQSSGSASGSVISTQTHTYGSELSDVIQRYNRARVEGFSANSSNALDTNFLYIARKRQPDNLHSSDLTRIVSEDTENFFTDDDVSDNFYSFEKSMYGAISDEMLNMFSTALEFNNLIGQPNQRYNHEYHLMSFMKDKFFDDVENDLDIEKFTTFYKWIDDSISKAMSQLIPASARFSKKINNVVESHVLERNKYVHKMPLLTRFTSTEGSIRGIEELRYDWNTGHSPVGSERESIKCRWQRERKEKTGTREIIRSVKNNRSLQSSGLSRKDIAGNVYLGSPYYNRKLSTPYDFEMKHINRSTIHGGINYRRNKNKLLFYELIAPAGQLDSGVPQNVITIGVGSGSGIVNTTDCDDPIPANQKEFHDFEVRTGKLNTFEYGDQLKGDTATPGTFVKGTVHSGYNKIVKSLYRSDVIVTNLHSDTTYDTNDIPIQGPFTQAHVGGHQSRHVDLNRFSTDKTYVVTSRTGAAKAKGSVSLALSNLVVGDSVTVEDSDRTSVTAQFSSFFDLFESKWSSAGELVDILNNKLDVSAVLINNSTLDITQSAVGTGGNRAIVASTSSITVAGFSGGTNGSAGPSTTFNIDSTANRPEAWAFVLKEHPSVAGTPDGAAGFIGPDYGSPYPNGHRAKATRFRDEHAKRPVNIRNISYNTSSVKVGNFRKGYEIVTLQKSDQRRWYRDAYDNDLDLPITIKNALPNTTNYMTLISQAPFVSGNVFGVHANNRQPDGEQVVVIPPIIGVTASAIEFKVLSQEFTGDDDVFKITLSGSGSPLTKAFVFDANATGSGGGTTSQRAAGVDLALEAGGVTPLTSYVFITASQAQPALNFYQNINNSIEAAFTPPLAVDFTTGSQVMSKGLHFSRRNASFLKVTGGAGTFRYPNQTASPQPITVAFHLQLTGTAGGHSRGIYIEESTSGGHDHRLKIFYNGSFDRLRTILRYSGTNNNFYDIENFAASYITTDGTAPPSNHFAITYDGATTEPGSVKIFINGVSSSFDSISIVGGAGGSPNRADGDLIIGNTGTGNSEPLCSPLLVSSSIDDFVILNKVATQDDINDLYNFGRKFNKDNFTSLNFDNDFKMYLSFDDADHTRTGLAIPDPIPDGQEIRDLSTNNQSAIVVSPITGGVLTGPTVLVDTPASASFVLSGSDAGNQFNGQIFFPSNFSGSFGASGSNIPALENILPRKDFMNNGVDPDPGDVRIANDIVITRPRTDLSSSTFEINCRFSAPGGPEVQSIGYLDAQSSTFSVHNALPFRNLSVLGLSSGESNTIRVNDHIGQRRGLKALLSTHMGKFGSDSTYGSVIADGFVTNGSFLKQHRNKSKRMEFSGSSIITGSNFDNGFVSSPIPRSEFQYSWINAAISGSNWEDGQRILGYAPRDGILSASVGYVEALVFPSSSQLFGED